jgi:hypothetical protein
MLVSVNSAGNGSGNAVSGDVSDCSISADGRYVAFVSKANNLGPTIVNGADNIFARDLQTGRTVLVSANNAGVDGNGNSSGALISGNGRFVVFNSGASNLAANDTGQTGDVFQRDLLTQTTVLVSVDRTGTRGGASASFVRGISADGRFVLFESFANDLVTATHNNNQGSDIYVRDMQTGTTTLVSVNQAGTATGNGTSSSPMMTPDVRYVVFQSQASDLVPNDNNGPLGSDIFVRDLVAGTTTLVSANSAGTASGNSSSRYPVISGNGRFVAFESDATDLVAINDTNNASDVFVRDLLTQTTALVSINSAGNATGNRASGNARKFSLSADGRLIVFQSLASNLAPNDVNGTAEDIFLRNLQTGTTTFVSANSTNTGGGNGQSYNPKITPDGRFVVFDGLATDLVANVNVSFGIGQAFLRNLATNTTTLVSANTTGTGSGNAVSFFPVISDDARTVAFTSHASNLVTNDTNGTTRDIFAYTSYPTGVPVQIQFSQAGYSVNEGSGFINITVTRTDSSGFATVRYASSDSTDANFRCDPLTAGQPTGIASRKCDYHIVGNRLFFAPGESTKQFTLSIVNDVYTEGPETFTLTLSNPAYATLGQNSSATVTINDNDPTPGAANPIDHTRFFVRQLYVDLLGREPDSGGWDGWTNRIDQCGQPGQPPPPCDRVTVGGDGFLRSGEFFDRQFFILRLYRTALGRILHYDEVGDLAYVSGFLTNAELESNKWDLVAEIMSRPEFTSRYNGLPNGVFVDRLLQTAGVTVPQNVRDNWATQLDMGPKTRLEVFREISERPEVSNRYLHEAQVVSAYYGFFTRNPDGAYLNYLQRLDSGEITLGDLANAFINAQEYRQRFGQ